MNSTVAKDIGSNNVEKPEVTTDRDSEVYQPITPFDFKVDDSINMKHEDGASSQLQLGSQRNLRDH